MFPQQNLKLVDLNFQALVMFPKNQKLVDRNVQALFIFPQKNLKLVYWNFQAMGGFPSPEITWWIGTRRLKPEKTVTVIFCNE